MEPTSHHISHIFGNLIIIKGTFSVSTSIPTVVYAAVALTSYAPRLTWLATRPTTFAQTTSLFDLQFRSRNGFRPDLHHPVREHHEQVRLRLLSPN